MNTNTSKSISSTTKSSQKQAKPKGNNPFCCSKKSSSDFLYATLNKKGLDRSTLYVSLKEQGLKKTTISNLFSGITTPSPLSARQLLFALHISYSESNDFLKHFGYAWSDNEVDVCVQECLKNGVGSWDQVLDYAVEQIPDLKERYPQLAA